MKSLLELDDLKFVNIFILNNFSSDEIHDGMNIELYYQ